MAQRAHLLSKNLLFSGWLGLLLTLSCTERKEQAAKVVSFSEVDVSQIPNDTISSLDPSLQLENGIYFYATKPYSGFIKEVYDNRAVKSIGSYYQGMQHGLTKTFYPGGSMRDIRSYKENVGYGRHYGYWENGNMKFDFAYHFDKREGTQKQWYESGSPYAFLNFRDDREDGLQQAWRENGKPYINYEARDGFRYGLQKSALCYSLEDEEVKSTVFKEEVAVKE
ncbi:MAG: hypothetical protein RIF36_15670 [Imperialibacter sp.]|uniref:toxin-antitoxin system YwqK family antitoxin n=1 Tax=Imperialibacter sp. TaxID=2038411 RepID=UPI0032F063E4